MPLWNLFQTCDLLDYVGYHHSCSGSKCSVRERYLINISTLNCNHIIKSSYNDLINNFAAFPLHTTATNDNNHKIARKRSNGTHFYSHESFCSTNLISGRLLHLLAQAEVSEFDMT